MNKIKQPDFLSKVLSLVVVFIFLCSFGLGSYLPSALSGDVNKKEFTVSQSLAYSIKPLFVILLTIAILTLAYLIYYRGHNYLYIRLFLLLVMYAFIVTIVWVTTMYSEKDHYILAAFIFAASCIFITLNSLAIYSGLKIKTRKSKIILIIIPILAFIGMIGLIISNLVKDKVSELFPSFENYMLVIKGLSILTLGFI